MPISPKEAKADVEALDQKDFVDACENIDKELRRRFCGGAIRVELENINNRVWPRLKRAYEAAGWVVTTGLNVIVLKEMKENPYGR